jgi:beta-glucosidase
MRAWVAWGTALALALAGGAAAQDSDAGVAHPERWPAVAARPAPDPAVEARVAALMARMSLEDKVGQLIQPDIATLTPDDLKTYKVGAVLNGGNSGPGGDDFAPPAEWLRLADALWDANAARADGRPSIPLLWGTDAVHGNNNVPGATLFPHNIGLGAAHDPELIEAIGRVTAEETAAAGQDWSFAPTVAVARDDRWGRTYESYSEDPALVASYAARVVAGLQGEAGGAGFLGPRHVLATAKHFVADGGTEGGRDQGDARIGEAELRDVHAAGYPPALRAGALIVMASFSSWHGARMSANRSLLTGVLKGRWGFSGFVVSDWNSYAAVPGCRVESCAAAINAGLDMFMVSGDWKALYRNTLAQARSGEIPAARLDDAVRRILRVKLLAGTFAAGRPSTRPLAGRFERIGAPDARALARRAVRQSLVLLKNEGGLLPLAAGKRILIAGEAADSPARQAGGWSLSWQGTGVPASAWRSATTIRQGIEAAVRAGGGRADYAADGAFSAKPDAAVVVFGEPPYAEWFGDRPNLAYSPADRRDLALLRRLKAAGVPVVAVFLSGRPLWVNAEINASDAFVAAFLPGSEGGGVADLLFRTRPDYDFTGRLSFSWPKRPDQYRLNRDEPGYDPLFPLGYGLSYASRSRVGRLDEALPPGLASDADAPPFADGRVPDGWSLVLAEGDRSAPVAGIAGRSPGGALTVAGVDRRRQEDARRLTWTGPAAVRIEPKRPLDLSAAARSGLALVLDYRVDRAPAGPVTLGMAGGRAATVPLTATLRAAPPGQRRTVAAPLSCFAGLDAGQVAVPFALESRGALELSVAAVRIGRAAGAACPR